MTVAYIRQDAERV